MNTQPLRQRFDDPRKDVPALFRYPAKVKHPDGRLSAEYVDWFTDDDDARAGFRALMTEQGYQVESVEIGFPCIVSIK